MEKGLHLPFALPVVRALGCCLCFFLSDYSFAADLADVARQLSGEIRQAQTQLSNTEGQIGRERAQLAQQLNKAQTKVLELRDKTAATRRLADEKTLGLSQIESRLTVWQDQSRYQKRLLTGFLDKVGRQNAGAATAADVTEQLNQLQRFVEAQTANLQPGWQASKVLLPDGQLADSQLLSLGPVQWFLQSAQETSGLVATSNNLSTARLVFDGTATDGLVRLHNEGTGIITFDPTLTRVLKLADSRETLWEQLVKGGFWVIPIIGFGLFAGIIAISKGVFLYRLPPLMPALAARVRAANSGGSAALAAISAQVQGAQAELLDIALAVRNQTHRDEQLYVCLLKWRNKLEHWLGSIALTASVSPLLGLVGTVSGMITTFKLMTVFGASDANTVSAGISEAMISTKLGLVVAVPALIAHALMTRLVKNQFTQLENLAVELSQLPLEGERHDA